MMQNLMVDIETMGTHSSEALILSAAFVPFRLLTKGPEMLDPLLMALEIAPQLLIRRVERGTQEWWMKQSLEAQRHWVFPEKRYTPVDFWVTLYSYIEGKLDPKFEIWANGVSFDIGNLENLFHSIGCEIPWYYNSMRDYRTLTRVLPQARSWDQAYPVQQTCSHDPVYDCIKQIFRLWEVWPADMMEDAPKKDAVA